MKKNIKKWIGGSNTSFVSFWTFLRYEIPIIVDR